MGPEAEDISFEWVSYEEAHALASLVVSACYSKEPGNESGVKQLRMGMEAVQRKSLLPPLSCR